MFCIIFFVSVILISFVTFFMWAVTEIEMLLIIMGRRWDVGLLVWRKVCVRVLMCWL